MATPKRSALGRGLDALISMDNIVTSGTSSIHEIELSQIVPNPDQPRREFDQEALEELASSIRELGIIQPISLRQVDGGNYQIIAGERRYRAAQMAGLETIPAYVRTVEDETLMEMALIENIQREDLNSIEIALAFQKLIELYQLTQEKLSERVGKKRTTIANYLRLLKLPAEVFRQRGWKYALLTGSTNNRPSEIAHFTEQKDVQAFLISLKAGGVGLNLTQADYVFIIDPWWNPAAESQAIARAHRIGQDKQVIAYRFITQNSIEEKILQLQEDKRRLAETFITDSEALPALSNEQWADLLK